MLVNDLTPKEREILAQLCEAEISDIEPRSDMRPSEKAMTCGLYQRIIDKLRRAEATGTP